MGLHYYDVDLYSRRQIGRFADHVDLEADLQCSWKVEFRRDKGGLYGIPGMYLLHSDR